ncbi:MULTISPECIES: hypothetical protein [unclassified Pseudofrankia]|uniref:hypothetical protein n=1 Tax=unclassified Pseudofrankia TaxID=2994372 RepID=UPI0018E2C8F8|nr:MULTISPECIES: hypothetical protein [unclassified Pseudofrankia]MDT3439811.1 hypothetical protein [Pseudofrankia sp. BMG5.37]
MTHPGVVGNAYAVLSFGERVLSPTAGSCRAGRCRTHVVARRGQQVSSLGEAAGDRLSALYKLIALHGLRRREARGAAWEGLDCRAQPGSARPKRSGTRSRVPTSITGDEVTQGAPGTMQVRGL